MHLVCAQEGRGALCGEACPPACPVCERERERASDANASCTNRSDAFVVYTCMHACMAARSHKCRTCMPCRWDFEYAVCLSNMQSVRFRICSLSNMQSGVAARIAHRTHTRTRMRVRGHQGAKLPARKTPFSPQTDGDFLSQVGSEFRRVWRQVDSA